MYHPEAQTASVFRTKDRIRVADQPTQLQLCQPHVLQDTKTCIGAKIRNDKKKRPELAACKLRESSVKTHLQCVGTVYRDGNPKA